MFHDDTPQQTEIRNFNTTLIVGQFLQNLGVGLRKINKGGKRIFLSSINVGRRALLLIDGVSEAVLALARTNYNNETASCHKAFVGIDCKRRVFSSFSHRRPGRDRHHRQN